jgi:hypothetical protein
MPLIACPDCEKHVSDSAPSCIHCGLPLRSGTEVAAETAPQRVVPIGAIALQQSAYSCPKCGSEDTKKLSVLWRDGVQSINTRTAGVGVAGGRLGVGVAATQGIAQSASSQIAAPPTPKEVKGLGWAVLFGFIAFTSITQLSVGGFIFAAIFAWLSYSAFKRWTALGEYNKNVHPGLLREWESTYRCGRCENMYVLGE